MNKYIKIFWCFSLIINIISCGGLLSTPSPTNEEVASGNIENNNDSTSLPVNKIPPEDILRELSWSPGAGPGGSGSSRCTDADKIPTIRYDPYDVELMDSSGMTTCGWQGEQELQASIISPDGKVQHEVIYADEDGMAEVSIAPDNSDPEGVYEFTISDGDTVLKSNAYFRKPVVPRIHSFPDNTLRFYNFPASEPIRLFLYKCTHQIEDSWCTKWEFIGWQKYQISANGDLEVKVTETKDVYYIAVTTLGIEISLSEASLPTTIFGENSKFYESTENYWNKSQEYLLCPENIPSPSDDSEWGQIANAGGAGVNLYSRPRATARVMEKLQNGRTLSFSHYPKCNDGNIFWEVHLLDNQFKYDKFGYVSLADFDGNYYFKPIILNEGNSIECGAVTSYLSVGNRGKVVSSDSSNLRLRDKPGIDQKIVELLPEGTPFLVLDGLECIDNENTHKHGIGGMGS